MSNKKPSSSSNTMEAKATDTIISTPFSRLDYGANDSYVDNPTLVQPSHDDSSYSSNEEEEEDVDDDNVHNSSVLSLEELLYSVSSYHAIVFPVTITMTLAALAAVFINDEETIENGAKEFASAYQVWKLDDSGNSGSTSKNLAYSIGNTLIIVLVIATMTFGMVALYKYRCMKFLLGYMIFSSASLLGLLGDYMADIAIEIYRIPIDVITYYLGLYNFAIVGVVAIFYQTGIPSKITQFYLVCTSVILAWHLSHFDDFTAWTLLVMLALYDLCAVLTPCGPLKALVNLMQEEDSPEMPGLLYEAQLPQGTTKPGANNNKSTKPSSQTVTTVTNHNSTKELIYTTPPNKYDSTPNKNNTSQIQSTTIPSSIPTSGTLSSPQRTVIIPLAIAKLYKLPITHTHQFQSSSSSLKKRSSTLSQQESTILADETTTISMSPLLSDNNIVGGRTIDFDEFYKQKFTAKQLRSKVQAELPPTSTSTIEQQGNSLRYFVKNQNGDVRRILEVDSKGKVFDTTDVEDDYDDDDDESMVADNSSIRLGLGDFIFYSVLVAKAALYSFTTFAACMLVILAGLGGTLVLLSVYHSALPALPISIFLGVTFYLLTRIVIEPWVEVIMTSPVYV